jgi:hypothetical protein
METKNTALLACSDISRQLLLTTGRRGIRLARRHACERALRIQVAIFGPWREPRRRNVHIATVRLLSRRRRANASHRPLQPDGKRSDGCAFTYTTFPLVGNAWPSRKFRTRKPAPSCSILALASDLAPRRMPQAGSLPEGLTLEP